MGYVKVCALLIIHFAALVSIPMAAVLLWKDGHGWMAVALLAGVAVFTYPRKR